jgi:hypothetical protein
LIGLLFNFKFLLEKEKPIYKIKKIFSPLILLSIFSIGYFAYEGVQFAKTIRYFYPIYWCFAIFGGFFIVRIFQSFHGKKYIILFFVFFILLVYPVSFLQIYTKPHSRVAASRWIFQNVKNGSNITFEEWDDPLPLLVDDHPLNVSGTGLPMFWPDTDINNNKWRIISEKISGADYIFLSSNRVYGSISRRPDLYPITKKYYQLLFSQQLGFEKVQEFSSRPTVPFINYELNDDNSEESFTVYDHPKVLIYKNTGHFSSDKIYQIINQSSKLQ